MRRHRLVDGVHFATTGFWLAAILLVGLVAGLTFPTLKDLDPTMLRFDAYGEDHWSIIGGYLTNPLFGVLRVIQWVCIAIAGVTLLSQLLHRGRGRLISLLRVVAFLVAVGAVLFDTAVLSGRMQSNLTAFRAAAEAGEIDVANTHRDAFDADHPTASTTLMINAGAVAVFLGAGIASTGRREP